MEDAPFEDETIPDDDEKRMMFIGIGAVGIILGIFLSAIWGGFGVVDEFDVPGLDRDRRPLGRTGS